LTKNLVEINFAFETVNESISTAKSD